MAAARFVHFALAADLPPGWHTQPDHLRHTEQEENPDDRPPGRAPDETAAAILSAPERA